MNEKGRIAEALVGLAALGCAITGVASLVVALWPLVSLDYLGRGVGLAAAALAFGLLANALLRD
jgi:hypothetical protein